MIPSLCHAKLASAGFVVMILTVQTAAADAPWAYVITNPKPHLQKRWALQDSNLGARKET